MLGTRRTGFVPGSVMNKDGRHHCVQIPGVIVMGRHLRPSKKAASKGMF